MNPSLPLPAQLREMAAEICALLDTAPFVRVRVERILADALGLVEDECAAHEAFVAQVLEEQADAIDAATVAERGSMPRPGGVRLDDVAEQMGMRHLLGKDGDEVGV